MKSSFGIDRLAFSKNWGMFLLWGVLLIILGIAAISATVLTTIVSVVVIGAFLCIGGVITFFDSFTFWRRHKTSAFILHILMALLYFVVGVMLIRTPLLASISITLVLGIFYVMMGVFRMIYSMSARLPRWGWGFFSGLIALMLGCMILASWPMSGLYIIGLFVGIDLLFFGWFYIMAAMSGKRLAG